MLYIYEYNKEPPPTANRQGAFAVSRTTHNALLMLKNPHASMQLTQREKQKRTSAPYHTP